MGEAVVYQIVISWASCRGQTVVAILQVHLYSDIAIAETPSRPGQAHEAN